MPITQNPNIFLAQNHVSKNLKNMYLNEKSICDFSNHQKISNTIHSRCNESTFSTFQFWKFEVETFSSWKSKIKKLII